jgi:hypothetical protein
MYTKSKDKFSEIIDITLYKYNSIDLKIWGILTRHYNSRKLTDDSVLISFSDLNVIINSYFHNDLNRIDSIGDSLMHKEATSIYFIKKIFDNMENIRWVKITLNKNMNYQRVVEIDQMKTIKFSIKTLRGTFRLFEHFNEHQIYVLNKILIKMGVFKRDEHFVVIKTQDLLNRIDNYLNENNTNEIFTLLNAIIHYFEVYEVDNPEILLITDIESDI